MAPYSTEQIDPLASQLDSVLRDAGDVQQIVGDAHQVEELALDRGARFLDKLRIGAREPHDLDRRPDRRQGIAQLV